jgi:hypothetical protein
LIHSYTLHDAISTAAIIPVFAIFLFAPGYVLGWATNLLDFRFSSLNRKFLLSLPFSIVISTILTNIVGRYLPARVVLWIFIVLTAAVALHGMRWWLSRRKTSPPVLHRAAKIVLLLAGLWTLVVIASLVDIEVGRKLYVSTALWDHAVRIAFLNSTIRSGTPPTNPFSYLGYAPVARYYYYWYVLCSYPARLTHIGARYVLYGSSVWAGFSLAALVPIYLTDFLGITENVRRKAVIGILLLSVTGLDVLPTLYEFLRARTVYVDMEWWDPVQITSWQDALIWVPHHVAALIACFAGFLVLWSVRESRENGRLTGAARATAGVFAALAFAAAAGLSVYVTFTFGLFLLCWGIRLFYKRAFSDFLLYLGVACLSVAISLPYLHDLLPTATASTAPRAAAGVAGGFIAFGLRSLPSFLSTPYFLKTRGFLHPEFLAPFGVVAVYVLEFGVFAIVGWERLRKDVRSTSKLGEAEIASWYFIGTTMLVITFVRSSVISNNDLAYRSAMIAQFILLLWGADYLDGWMFAEEWNCSKRMTAKNMAIVCTLFLGFMGTVYSLAILRTYTVLDDAGMIVQHANWFPHPPFVGTDLFEIRTAYEALDRMLPSDSIVQYNPMSVDYLPLLQYDKFQSVDAFPDCGTEFGGDVSRCAPVQNAIAEAFNKPGDTSIHELCSRLSIDVLVARNSDPAWKDRTSWIWKNAPIAQNSYIRAFRCR